MNGSEQNWYSLQLVGAPVWLIVPAAILVAWWLLRIQRRELDDRPRGLRIGMAILRGAAAVALVLMLLEPALTKESRESTLPVVTVLVDQSGSMEVGKDGGTPGDKLDAAIALGLVPEELRPTNAAKARRELAAFLEDAPTLSAALAALQESGMMGPAVSAERLERAAQIAMTHAEEARELVELTGATQGLPDHFLQLAAELDRIGDQFDRALARVGVPSSSEIELSLNGLQRLAESSEEIIERTEAEQSAVDETLVTGADADSPIKQGLEELERLSRRERALRLLQKVILPKLDGRARVELLGFGQSSRKLLDAGAAQGTDEATDFESVLKTVARDWSHDYLGGVLVLSDGRQTAGGDPLPPVRALRSRGTAFSTIGVAESGHPPDAVVSEILGSPDVFLGETIRIDVRYRVAGFGDKPWDLVVSGFGEELDRKTITGNGEWQTERFEFPAREAGVHTLTARLEPTAGAEESSFPAQALAEAIDEGVDPAGLRGLVDAARLPEADHDNNQARMLVSVNEDPMRVLIVDALARWECRYLVTLFERDRKVTIDRQYRMIGMSQGDGSLLPRTQEELDGFDLVILGDLGPSELSTAEQQRLEAYVSRRGGFLICLAGPRSLPHGYGLGGIAKLLPVRVVRPPTDGMNERSIALTSDGDGHPITSVLKDEQLNVRLWPLLPPLRWIADGVVAKPGAIVLLEADDEERTPLVAVQRYGAGRVLWMGSPESWRWRDQLGDTVHRRFWLQAVRWGVGTRLRGKDPRLQMALDRNLVLEGEPVLVRARAHRTDGRSIGAPLLVRVGRLDEEGNLLEKSVREFPLLASEEGSTIRERSIDALEPGVWSATVSTSEPGFEDLSETRRFLVRRRQDQEMIELAADPEALRRLAEEGGGRYGDIGDADRVVAELVEGLEPRMEERRLTYSLWDNYTALLLVGALLCVEWLWRKRSGLP
ncbi:hypothetical protein Pan216_09470 [Planctomycetes bacterium Pan216]|uniref:Glutamine amidotransferase domain-containing protein n=1 Tax=Kolteria novifilia TaxID=2527975 RepID=A0A518AZH3_9BACT|nr:hypothetical protein Pan216_09470 [Planctomycetes bacterium Pan216]